MAAMQHIFKFKINLFPETYVSSWNFHSTRACEEARCALDISGANRGPSGFTVLYWHIGQMNVVMDNKALSNCVGPFEEL